VSDVAFLSRIDEAPGQVTPMATREFGRYGRHPELASLINRIQDEINARLGE
jgi:hypothetical protein